MSDLHKATCPTILPACNCDLPLAERQFVAAVLGDPAAFLAAQRPEGVTVDPDSPRQVQRLADHLIAAMCRQDPDWDKSRAYEIRSHLATALREYAAEAGDPR